MKIVNDEFGHDLRKLAAIVLGIFGAIMLYTALTVPMIAASGPAMLGLASGFVAWKLWPVKSKEGGGRA